MFQIGPYDVALLPSWACFLMWQISRPQNLPHFLELVVIMSKGMLIAKESFCGYESLSGYYILLS